MPLLVYSLRTTSPSTLFLDSGVPCVERPPSPFRCRLRVDFNFGRGLCPLTLTQELRTPNGKGRLSSDIGTMVNDKLVRLLSRLVMRETLKTSTLTSVMIASLALDTDARGRKQGRHNNASLSPPPVQGKDGRHHGAGR